MNISEKYPFIFILSHHCPLTSLKREIKYNYISRLIKVATLIKRETKYFISCLKQLYFPLAKVMK
jgi:hypothetical protein